MAHSDDYMFIERPPNPHIKDARFSEIAKPTIAICLQISSTSFDDTRLMSTGDGTMTFYSQNETMVDTASENLMSPREVLTAIPTDLYSLSGSSLAAFSQHYEFSGSPTKYSGVTLSEILEETNIPNLQQSKSTQCKVPTTISEMSETSKSPQS